MHSHKPEKRAHVRIRVVNESVELLNSLPHTHSSTFSGSEVDSSSDVEFDCLFFVLFFVKVLDAEEIKGVSYLSESGYTGRGYIACLPITCVFVLSELGFVFVRVVVGGYVPF
jgi:hypothetical protein